MFKHIILGLLFHPAVHELILMIRPFNCITAHIIVPKPYVVYSDRSSVISVNG